jgi:hypothetical protein
MPDLPVLRATLQTAGFVPPAIRSGRCLFGYQYCFNHMIDYSSGSRFWDQSINDMNTVVAITPTTVECAFQVISLDNHNNNEPRFMFTLLRDAT